ncbi:PEP-CTERM sorting domain-containing protein [Pseudodesulfovibrio cashew]|uniref:PEP-CTERM sorting domain-containing protein n=1 Tax=Pseudodesulfovibrio cashew TaxID=2678688 RepID=A0A6I6JJ40_9BACT|nr:PEP-CTERM sorting domain-containing protein [Pseudodesulfovibrio cashew]QGY40187.1 PEP-CTERM sorting domain-containing protein [Pseudodesulfovibrio cashew]
MMFARRFLLVFALTFCVFGLPVVAQSATLGTFDRWYGSYIGNFGEVNTATYGQIVSNPTSIYADRISFYLDDIPGDDFVDFQLMIGSWGGSAMTELLWESPAYATTNNGGLDGFERFDMSVDHVLLNGGTEYIIFLTASNLFDGLDGRAHVGTTTGSGFVFFSNRDDFSLLYSDWDTFFIGRSLAYEIEYTPAGQVVTPEPSTFILLCAGLLGLIGLGRKRFTEK